MQLTYKTPIWFYPEPIDFRKQIDGLITLTAECLNKDPARGELFIFRNRSANKLKFLWSDESGFWLCYKRLNKGGRFRFPKKTDSVLSITHDQLTWLLSGLDMLKQKPLPKTEAKYFY